MPIFDGRAILDDELVILNIERPTASPHHWGGAIRFGPDGQLYLGIGDATCRVCPQDLGTLQGKIIHIDVRDASPAQPYRVPNSNPFVGVPGARPEIWAYGLRNPWRMAFDPHDGRLWIADVGSHSQEEVTVARHGANLGWPLITYATHQHGDCAIVGGAVYSGTQMPWLMGSHLFGDYCSGRIWALVSDVGDG